MSEDSRNTEEPKILDLYSDENILKKTLSCGSSPILKRDDVTVKILVSQGTSEVFKDDNLTLSLEPQFAPQALIDLMCTMTLNEIAEVIVKADFFRKNFSEHIPELQSNEDVKVNITVKEIQKIDDIYGDQAYFFRFVEKTNEEFYGESTRAKIHYKVEINNYTYLDNTDQVPLQVMIEDNLIPSIWIEIIKKLRQGEHARVECNLLHEKARLLDNGRDTKLNLSSYVPSEASIAYLYIKVASFDTGLYTQNLSPPERNALAVQVKDQGNSSFKSGDNEKAIKLYESALATLDPVADDPGLLKPTSNLILSNISLCLLKLQKWTLAEEYATKVIIENNTDIKAYYRRGLARKENNKLEAALEDLKLAKSIAKEKNENDFIQMIQKEVSTIQAELKKANDLDKARFKNLFK